MIHFKNEFKPLLALSIPIALGQISPVLMGLVDNAMVGNLGTAELSAVGLANGAYVIFFIFGLGLMSSVSTLVSKYISQERTDLVSKLLKNTLYVALLSGLLINVLVWITIPFFPDFIEDARVAEMAAEFLLLLTAGTPFLIGGIGLKNFLDGLGYGRVTMVISLSGVAMNVLVNWMLIYGNMGFPPLGTAGAALATNFCRFLIFATQLLIIFTLKDFKSFRRFALRPNHKEQTFREILRVGVPSGFQYFFEAAAFGVAPFIAEKVSVAALAAHNLTIQLAAFTYMFATGISVAAGVRTAHFFGLKEKRNIRLSGTASLILVIIFMSAMALAFVLLRNVLPAMFSNDLVVIDLAADLFIVAALFQISDGVQCVSLGMLRGIQEVKTPMYIAATSYWLVALPAACLFVFAFAWGVNGLWLGLTVGLTVAAILLYLRFRKVTQYR